MTDNSYSDSRREEPVEVRGRLCQMEEKRLKEIEAIVRPYRIEDIRELLQEIGVDGMTITQVKGIDQQGHVGSFHGPNREDHFVPNIKLEVVVADEHVQKVISAVIKTAETGDAGNGKICLKPVEKAIRVRTEESGENAL